MGLLKGMGEFFALDIGTKAVRVLQLTYTNNRWSLTNAGYVPIAGTKAVSADSEEGLLKLGSAVMTAVGQAGIKTRNIAVGIPSQKAFVTVIDLPSMPDDELQGTIKYQADKYIPMATGEAKVDWAKLGQSAHDPAQQEILLASTANTYSEQLLEFIEGLGFNVIAFEPESIALARAMMPENAQDGQVIIDIGEQSTDLVIVYNGAPRLVRSIPTGLATMVKTITQNLNVQEDQARQFLLKFGLDSTKLEGQVVRALDNTIDSFATEITKSVKFFQTRYPSIGVSKLLVTGYSASVPQFAEFIASKTGLQPERPNLWANITVSSAVQQNLASVGDEFAVVIGLAERRSDV